MAVPFLPNQLTGALLAVEVAWGADLTAASSSWTWTDITADVRVEPGIETRHGRSDEAGVSQPASATMRLDNSTGAYSIGGQSPNWPYVRQGTPVRVRVDTGDGTWRTLFAGYADTWQPSWNQAATVADVVLSASGVLRRLAQHAAPVTSSLRRRLSTEDNVVAYWPLEEGKRATVGLSAFEGHSPMWVFGEVDFAAGADEFACATQTVMVKGGALAGAVPSHAHSGSWQVRALMAFPDDGQGMADGGVLLRVWTTSADLTRIDVVYATGGGWLLRGYVPAADGTYTLVLDTGTIAAGLDGTASRVFLELTQDGADIDWSFGDQPVDDINGAGVNRGTLTSATLGTATQVEINPGGAHDGLTVGHVVVQDEVTGIFDDFGELSAYDGEASWVRYQRLCDENGVPREVFGDGTSFNQPTDRMGVQDPESLLALIREVEAVDGGMIFDGVAAGLTFYSRRQLENRPTPLPVGAGQLAAPLQPVDDDQGRINRAQVTRQDGATAVFEDTAGPLGVAAVGAYEAAVTVNVQTDAVLAHYASWAVHKGTVEGYRYPTLSLDFAATPELIPTWAPSLTPGRRVEVTDAADIVGQHPTFPVRLQIQGYQQTITPYSWTVTLNCAPYEPWRITRLASDTGDTNEYLARLDTDGATLASPAAAGATSLSVATTGPLWTTDPDDLPLTIEVGGIPVTVTAVSGASSPQTFTVTGSTVTKALASGSAVTLHRPTGLGL